jgi:hypothetical protein
MTALPPDPAVAAMAASDRELIGRTWAERARSEAGAGLAFAELAVDLPADLPGPVRAIAHRAADDERRHADLCRRVAEVYLGQPVDGARPRPGAPVRIAGDPPLRSLLRLVLVSSVNETIGAAYLQACLADASGPLPRAAVRELLRDEVDHARIGWAALAVASPARRTAVAAALPGLLSACREAWRARAAGTPTSLPPGHGCLAQPELQRLVDDALADLVVPGFAELGIDIGAARAWLAAARP